MKDIDKNIYAALLDQVKRNPSLLEKLQKDIIAEPSLYQKNSMSDFTSEDNRRIAVLVLDWIYANKAYPREIIADTKTGHLGFKNEAGTILSKTKELEDRLNDLFGDGEGATGNDIKVEIEDLLGKTLGAALKELIDYINANPVKWNVQCATTEPLPNLEGLITIDGYVLQAGNRVLVKNQTDRRQNGIYVASAGTWTRPAEFDSVEDVKGGCNVIVESGNTNFKSMWMLLPFSDGNPEYDFYRVNRFLKPVDHSSLSVDPINETIRLENKLDSEQYAGIVKVNEEGLVTEAKRYNVIKTIDKAAESIDMTTLEQEQFAGIDFSDGTRIIGTEWGINFKRQGGGE